MTTTSFGDISELHFVSRLIYVHIEMCHGEIEKRNWKRSSAACARLHQFRLGSLFVVCQKWQKVCSVTKPEAVLEIYIFSTQKVVIKYTYTTKTSVTSFYAFQSISASSAGKFCFYLFGAPFSLYKTISECQSIRFCLLRHDRLAFVTLWLHSWASRCRSF